MTMASLPGLTDAQFDELSRRVADAYARDDHRCGEQLYAQLHLTGILPHMQRNIRWFVRGGSLDVDDVRGLAIVRIIASLKAGRAVQQAELVTIYRRVAWDTERLIDKHEGHDNRKRPTDDQLLDDLLQKGRGTVQPDTAAEDAAFAIMRRDVDKHLRELNKPQWVELWHHWCEGITEGPAIAKLMGVASQKARVLKMDLGHYLCGVGRDLLTALDVPEGN